MINGNELRPGMVTPAGRVLTLEELTVRHGEFIQAPAQPPGTWHFYPWPNGRDPAGSGRRTYIEPRAEWRPVLERWLPGYTWPNEPSLETLERLLMAPPFNLSPSDFNLHHDIKRVVWILENQEPAGEDLSAYTPAGDLAVDEYASGIKELRKILKAHPWIRRLKPSKQRLLVHAGDWNKYKKQADQALDESSVEPMVAAITARATKERESHFRSTSREEK